VQQSSDFRENEQTQFGAKCPPGDARLGAFTIASSFGANTRLLEYPCAI